MELQEAIKELESYLSDHGLKPNSQKSWQSIKVELESMEHRLDAYERDNERQGRENLHWASYNQGATRTYESVIEGLAHLMLNH